MKKILVFVLFCSVLIMSCKKVMDENASSEEIKNNQNEIVDQAIDDLIYGNITANEALNILNTWRFKYQKNWSTGLEAERLVDAERKSFDDVVYGVFNAALYDKNKAVVKACINLIETSYTMEDMQKKAKAAGIW